MTLADSRIANAARKTTYDDNWLEVKHLLPEMTEHSRLYVEATRHTGLSR